MSLILGFFMGLLTALGLLGLLIYWLCRRSNNMAVAKFIEGITHAVAHKPKSPEALAASENAEATAGTSATHNERTV